MRRRRGWWLGAALALAWAGVSWGQAPGGERDLTTRYRLAEAYSEADAEGSQTAYEVAYRETVKVTIETPQAAPRVEEVKRTARFAERVGKVARIDSRSVGRVVRRYAEARVTPDPWGETGAPALMSGLELLIDGPATATPRMTVLTPGRSLWEHEYRFAAGNPLMPAMALTLPDRPLRLGDTWTLSQAGATALLGEPVESGAITGKLTEIRPAAEEAGAAAPAPADEVAILDLSGRVATRSGSTAVRARLEFTFRVMQPLSATPEAPNPDRPLMAAGGITSVRHVQVSTAAGDAEAGTPGFEQRRELVLKRRWPVEGEPLLLPGLEPEATVENSWLLYADAEGRFHFRHPQAFRLDPRAPGAGPDQLTLVQFLGETPDLLVISYLPDGAPKPEEAFAGSFERYRSAGFEVLPLDPKALPEADWPGMMVHRVEAAMTPPANAPATARTHMDGYVLAPGGGGAFQAMALTNSADQVQAFRMLAERVLKTLKAGRP